jgi:hypothetical protein
MATIEDIRTPMTTREVDVQVCMARDDAPLTADEFDAFMDAVLTVIETKAAALALGPVVGGNLERREVELTFTLEVSSSAEIHQKVGLVMTALEHELPVLIETGSRMAPAGDLTSRTA